MSYYLKHRSFWENGMFADEPFTEREAFDWLIAQAAWKDVVIKINDRPISLKRGQLSFSQRFLASKWKWPKTKVSRFLDKLKAWGSIVTTSVAAAGPATGPMLGQNRTNLGPAQKIITICNYSKYQDSWEKAGPILDQQPGQNRTSNRTKEEININKQINNNKKAADYIFIGEAFKLTLGDYEIFRKRANNLDDEQFHNVLKDCDFYYRGNAKNVFHKIGHWIDRENKKNDKKIYSYL